MITENTLLFLRDLKRNNTRDWFEAHRQLYEEAYGDFFDTVTRMVSAISSFDAELDAARPDPKSCIMRIYRDVRFSSDKTPYKTGFFAFISKGGRKGPYAGYYLHLEPGSSFLGGGLYLPEAPVLARTRQAIDSRFAEWSTIVSTPGLMDQFPEGVRPSGATKRPPKGYDDANPAIAYLRYKGYYTQRFFSDAELLDAGFLPRVAESCRAVMPMVQFLNEAIGSV
ncbi:MAG: DUF2461 domain-containing protein [Chlorobiaceae bacterium]|jgi:uncharacterized protein (TIGR02453 family)|nr:DUF2461 domain-containing protein [Chlorobiaceae bacterium]